MNGKALRLLPSRPLAGRVAPRSGAGWGDYASSALAFKRNGRIDQGLMNGLHDAIDLVEDLVVPKAKHAIAALRKAVRFSSETLCCSSACCAPSTSMTSR
jgi:hypothetical protein